MDAGSTLLGEKTAELEDGSGATVASVSIGNDGAEKVRALESCSFFRRKCKVLLMLLAVMEQLSFEQLFHLVNVVEC